MKISFDLEKRGTIVVLLIVGVVMGIIGVYAYNTNLATAPKGVSEAQDLGHTADETVVHLGGVDKTVQEALEEFKTDIDQSKSDIQGLSSGGSCEYLGRADGGGLKVTIPQKCIGTLCDILLIEYGSSDDKPDGVKRLTYYNPPTSSLFYVFSDDTYVSEGIVGSVNYIISSVAQVVLFTGLPAGTPYGGAECGSDASSWCLYENSVFAYGDLFVC
jgi:hypothetical protein